MNQRIRDLALDAIVENPNLDGWVFNDQELENFAKSIIQECMNICDEVRAKYGKYTFTARVCKERFADHFGVES